MEGSGPKEKARLLPPAQQKKGDLWRPLGGAGGRQGGEGREGTAGWNPAKPSPFQGGGWAAARCPLSPDPASCLPHLITEMSSPEGSLLLLTVLLYFPPAASAAILVGGGNGGLEETEGNVVIDLAGELTNVRREIHGTS